MVTAYKSVYFLSFTSTRLGLRSVLPKALQPLAKIQTGDQVRFEHQGPLGHKSYTTSLNPLPDRLLKEFADYNFKYDENGRKLSKRVENAVGKGEIAS